MVEPQHFENHKVVEFVFGIIKALKRRNIPLKATGVTSRNYKYWEEVGLFKFEKTEVRQNIKLTLPKYVLVSICERLRRDGIHIKNIKELIDYLSTEITKREMEEFLEPNKEKIIIETTIKALEKERKKNFSFHHRTYLEKNLISKMRESFQPISIIDYLIGYTLFTKSQSGVVVSQDVSERDKINIVPLTQEFISNHEIFSQLFSSRFYFISISEILIEYFGAPANYESLLSFNVISDNEKEILLDLRNPKNKEVNLRKLENGELKKTIHREYELDTTIHDVYKKRIDRLFTAEKIIIQSITPREGRDTSVVKGTRSITLK